MGKLNQTQLHIFGSLVLTFMAGICSLLTIPAGIYLCLLALIGQQTFMLFKLSSGHKKTSWLFDSSADTDQSSIDPEVWMQSATALEEVFNQLDDDLDHATQVIRSATGNIAGSLTGLETASDGQQTVLGEMIDQSVMNKTREIGFISEKIKEHVKTGVISLQFEDVTTQIIAHIRNRIYTLKNLSIQLSSCVDHLDDQKALTNLLDQLNEQSEEAMKSLQQSSVKQITVDTGSVELF